MTEHDFHKDADWFAARLPSHEILDEILGDDPIAALLSITRDRAPIEPGFRVPADIDIDPSLEKEFDIATAAAKKLKDQPKPNLSKDEVRALHAFVHLLARPALRVFGGEVLRVPESWRVLDQDREMVSLRISGVGRIDTYKRAAQGTGWFVAPDLLMTNNHVVAALCGINVHYTPKWRKELDKRLPEYNQLWAENPERRPAWDPGDSPGETEPVGRIRHVRVTHPKLDMALLEVEGVKESDQLIVPLSGNQPLDPDKQMYVAGYPAVEAAAPGLHHALVSLLFDGTDPIVHKRVSPGRVIYVDEPKAEHDASTLGGSSGSPVIDFETHRAVGLHYSGRYGEENCAVALWSVQSDPIFSDNGITFN